MALQMAVERHGDVSVLILAGKLSEADVQRFGDVAQGLVDTGLAKVILDLTKVNFIDSPGLGKIVSFSARMEKAGGKLVILNDRVAPNDYVAGLLKMTNLTKIFTIVGARGEA